MAPDGGTRLERRHPFGVYPLGNALLDPGAAVRRANGLGNFRACSDDQLLELARSFEADVCARLAGASAVLRAFFCHEEVWKEHCLRLLSSGTPLRWSEEGTWRATYALSTGRGGGEAAASSHGGGSAPSGEPQPKRRRTAAASSARVYSDVLHRSFFFAAAELDPFWLARENIARADARMLSTEEFVREYERKSMPVLLEGAAEAWPALKRWSREQLIERFGDALFTCGPCDLPLREWYAYADRNMDDTPLFVFDRWFHKRAPGLLDDYEVPTVFRGRDLFDLLGDDRPAFRWLLASNRKSGSKWHIDPNKTCAWNAVVRGRKRWLLLPPGCPPPGVRPTKDGAEVTQPVSLVEWFTNFYRELRKYAEHNPAWDLKEVTCGAGDAVFVPCGWWHCVLNLDDDTLAVTQNYCSETHVHSVRRFLKEKREQVSGIVDKTSLADRFDEALARDRPDLLAEPAPGADAISVALADSSGDRPRELAEGKRSRGAFSFWDHLRTTGRALEFVAPRGREA